MHEQYCLPCIYYGKYSHTCDFILIEGRRRGCPGGNGCTRRRTRKGETAMRKPKWDTELGRELWLEGKKDGEIADAMGIPTSSVTAWRRRHWEKVIPAQAEDGLREIMTQAAPPPMEGTGPEPPEPEERPDNPPILSQSNQQPNIQERQNMLDIVKNILEMTRPLGQLTRLEVACHPGDSPVVEAEGITPEGDAFSLTFCIHKKEIDNE